VSATDTSRPKDAASPKRSWTDLGPRVASAVVLILLTVAGLYVGGYIFAALVGAVFAGCYREWERMVTLKPLTPVGGVLIGLVALAAVVYPAAGWIPTAGVTLAACVVALASAPSLVGVWRAGGLAFFGLVIIAVLAMRGTGTEGILAGIFLALSVWFTDTGAFFTGRQIGGERLAPDISPSKTWSGALGGLALGTIAGGIAWLFVAPSSPWWLGIVFAALLSVAAQSGDLAESAIKRRFRVKDSGDIIPGHGGLMDRLDSLTFAVLLVLAIGLARGGIDGVAVGFLQW
jgi:phosphatidate cytidylyltransferase